MRTAATLLALSLALPLSVTERHLRAQSAPTPLVIVQAVDELWLPIPGAAVEFRDRSGTRPALKATTNRDGFASFAFNPRPSDSYDISVRMAGFNDAAMTDLRFGPCTADCPSSRYVQLRLTVARPSFAVR